MDESFLTITIDQLWKRCCAFTEFGIGDDILFCEVKGDDLERTNAIMSLMSCPIRFEGYICCLCRNGRFRLNLNLKSFEVGPNMIFINIPRNIISLSLDSPSRAGDLDLVFLFASRAFFSGLRFDFRKSYQESFKMFKTPCVTLIDTQIEMVETYFDLSRKIVNSSLSNRTDVLSSLLSSLTYLAADIWNANDIQVPAPQDSRTARLNQIFDRFISLVTDYHTSERNMAFYASKLNLTPKYLSKQIRQVSGRSAPEWVDSFVILEAKNLLKYSDCTVKEIVYRLNFPNQSVFYKFFKAHTGMTPSEYRNG